MWRIDKNARFFLLMSVQSYGSRRVGDDGSATFSPLLYASMASPMLFAGALCLPLSADGEDASDAGAGGR